MLSFISYTHLVLLYVLGAGPLMSNAAVATLYRDPGCPEDNPGPVCTDLRDKQCCRDHPWPEPPNYYFSARITGITASQISAISWNINNACRGATSYLREGSECVTTGYLDAYGVFYYTGRIPGLPPWPTARPVPSTIEECRDFKNPDIYHLRVRDETPDSDGNGTVLVPVSAKIAIDVLHAGGAVDWATSTVKEGKVEFFRSVIEKHGDGLDEQQISALRQLKEGKM